MGCCSASVQTQTVSEMTPPAGSKGAEEAPSASLLTSQTTTQSMPSQKSRSTVSSQQTIPVRIEKGDFVYWSQEDALDLEVTEVEEGKDAKDKSYQLVKVMGREEFIPQNQLVKYTGPRLRSKDIKSGAQVQFKMPHHDGIGGTGTGVVDGQTNSEVHVKTQEGSHKSQLWIGREDIHFLYVMVFSAHSLKNTDKKLGMGVVNNRSDPYIKIHLQTDDSADSTLQDKEVHTTEVLSDVLDPVWNQDFRFLYFGNVKSIRFEVRDSDVKLGSLKEDDFLGHAELSKEKWEGEQKEGFWDELTLTDVKDEPMKDDQGKESKIKVRVKLFAPKDHTMDISKKPALFCCGC